MAKTLIAPLEPRIPVHRATPWKLVPARVILHIAIWAGVLIRLIYWFQTGEELHGMNHWVWVMWIVTGLLGMPLIGLAYFLIRHCQGKLRYFAFTIEIISNVFSGSVLAEYVFSSELVGELNFKHQTVVSWVVTLGVVGFFVWIVANDFITLHGLEKRAHVLEIENGQNPGGEELMEDDG